MAFDYTDSAFSSSLIRAVMKNDREEVREMLNRGFSANLPDNRGWTPVHEAAASDSRIDSLKELLSHSSANINMHNFRGETPLFIACQNDCRKAVKYLLKQPKCNLNMCNSEGVSPLHVVCNAGYLYTVKCLIECGARVNIQDFNGYTPLHETIAVGCGKQERIDDLRYDICKYLLDHGANPDIMEYEGNFPFHFACQSGLVKCANLLFSVSKHRDLVNFKNNDGLTPLMMAVPSRNLLVVEMLLGHGANANIADNRNVTALHLAVHTGNYDMFNAILTVTSKECILKYCTFDEERDFDQLVLCKRINSIICLAIDTENFKFLKKVLKCGLDPVILRCPVIHAENLNKKTFTLHTPISFLLESKMCDLGHKTLDFLEALIEHGNPTEVTSKNMFINYISPVCAALVALNDSPVEVVMKCLQVLLQRGADPDVPHGKMLPEGRMPFAMEQAIMRENTEAVLLLLQYSNVLEPEDVLRWIEEETSANQEKIIELLLTLSPYYKPSDQLLTALIDNPRRKVLLMPKVHSLMSYCRTVIRKQLHQETQHSPALFRQQLSDLGIPKSLLLFLRFM